MAQETPRQRRWKAAADEEAQRGNEFAAGLFTLLAQPNGDESKRKERPPCGHPTRARRYWKNPVGSGWTCNICGHEHVGQP